MKPIIRYAIAWESPHKTGFNTRLPSLGVIISHGDSKEAITVHAVRELKYNDKDYICRFETKHKIYVLVKE